MPVLELLTDTDEYAVILAVIRAEFIEPLAAELYSKEPPKLAPPNPQAHLLISEETWGQGRFRLLDYQKFIGKRPGPSRRRYSEQEGDWITKNAFEPRRLSAEFFGPEKVKLLTDEQISELIQDNTEHVWEMLLDKNTTRRGYLTVSRVGFDPARQHALVAVRWTGTSKFGFGRDYLLERTGDDWSITGTDRSWIS